MVSVAARDSSNCIVAVGSVNTMGAAPALQVRAVALDLFALKPPVTSDRCRPKSGESTLLSVQRRTQGRTKAPSISSCSTAGTCMATHAPVVKSSAPVVYGGVQQRAASAGL